jgi:hypothetical protein
VSVIAARQYLSLMTADSQAKRLIRDLRRAAPVQHAAKDLLRASQLPLLFRDDPHVDDDLKKIEKGKSLPPVLLVRGAMSKGLPLVVSDGYDRICAISYFDDNAPVASRIANGRAQRRPPIQ